MRNLVLAIATILGVSLIGLPSLSAAPANGQTMLEATNEASSAYTPAAGRLHRTTSRAPNGGLSQGRARIKA